MTLNYLLTAWYSLLFSSWNGLGISLMKNCYTEDYKEIEENLES